MADETELMQTGIGLLTLALDAVQQGRHGQVDQEEAMTALMLLRQNATDFQMTVEEPVPAEYSDLIGRVAQDAVDAIQERNDLLMVGLLKGFMAIAESHLANCPEVDLAGVLQRAALELAKM